MIARGGSLAALLVAAAALLQSGCTTLADARQARGAGEARVYDAPADAIWNALPGVLKILGLDHVADNRGEGYLLAQRGISLFSYGENVAIFIETLPKTGRTRVEVVSKKSMETNIFAPNWAIDILDGLSQRLADAAPPAAPAAASSSAAATTTAAAAATATAKPINIEDVDAVPLLNERGREVYRDWLTRPFPRAFVISGGGRWFGTWGTKPADRAEPGNPAERALERCRKRNLKNCRLYAVDRRVVWTWE